MTSIEPGDKLSTAGVSAMVSGRVRLVVGDVSREWVPDEPERFAALLGGGVLARMLREKDRYREVVLVSTDGQTVLAMPRMTAADGGTVSGSGTSFVGHFDGTPAAPDDSSWKKFATWLASAVIAAATRSEFVVVERGGAEFHDEPYALAIVLTDGDNPRIHLECNPRPEGSALWPPGPDQPRSDQPRSDQPRSDQPRSDQRGQTISAPINRGALGASGALLVDGIRNWASSPLDVAITYASSGRPPLDVETL